MGIYYNCSAFKTADGNFNTPDFAFESPVRNLKLYEFGRLRNNDVMIRAALGFIIENPNCRIGYNCDWSENKSEYKSARGNYVKPETVKHYTNLFSEHRSHGKDMFILNTDCKEYINYDAYNEHYKDEPLALNVAAVVFNCDKYTHEISGDPYPNWYRERVKIVFDKNEIPEKYIDVTSQMYSEL